TPVQPPTARSTLATPEAKSRVSSGSIAIVATKRTDRVVTRLPTFLFSHPGAPAVLHEQQTPPPAHVGPAPADFTSARRAPGERTRRRRRPEVPRPRPECPNPAGGACRPPRQPRPLCRELLLRTAPRRTCALAFRRVRVVAAKDSSSC